MYLLLLAPDIQEGILFRSASGRISERSLWPIVCQIDRSIQRRMFAEMIGKLSEGREIIRHRPAQSLPPATEAVVGVLRPTPWTCQRQ